MAFALGVLHYLIEFHEDDLRKSKWAGWSGGSLVLLHTLCILFDEDERGALARHESAIEWWFENTVRRSSKHAIMNNWGNRWMEYFTHVGLIRNRHIYKCANNKVHIGLTNLGPGMIPRPRGEVIKEYHSNAHLMEAAYHSCYSPGFMKSPAIALKRYQQDRDVRVDGVYYENKVMLSDEFDESDILVIGRRGDGQCNITPDTSIFGHRGAISIFDVSVHPTYLFELYDNGYHQAAKYYRQYK